MSAPSKAHKCQSVRIRSEERLAITSEVNIASVEVTKQVKPMETMSQAVTKVNDVSPVIFIIPEVDALHVCGKQYGISRKWQEKYRSGGVVGDGMTQDGIYVNLGDLHGSVAAESGRQRYAETSRKGRGLVEGCVEVGSGGSTLSGIRTRTWGSARRMDDRLSVRHPDPRRSE